MTSTAQTRALAAARKAARQAIRLLRQAERKLNATPGLSAPDYYEAAIEQAEMALDKTTTED